MSFNLKAAEHSHNNHHEHLHEHDHEQPNHYEQMAHEHGVAQMFLTVVGEEVLIEVKSPLYNVIGFEHQPNNLEQKTAIKQQMQRIKTGQLIQISAAAKCEMTQQQLNNPFHHKNDELKHDEHNHNNEKHSNEHAEHKAHKDLSFEYQFHCKQPQALNNVNAQPLFKAWPNLQNLRVEWIYKNHQSALTLTADAPSISFE